MTKIIKITGTLVSIAANNKLFINTLTLIKAHLSLTV